MKKAGKMGWFVHDIKNRGVTAWLTCIALVAFYVILYFNHKVDKQGRLDAFAKDLFFFLPDSYNANKWTFYGLLYTLAITIGGLYVLKKYGHNRYQVIRTLVVMFVQASFAFSIPIMLKIFGQPEYYFSYFWPLKFDYFHPSTIVSQPLPFVLYSFVGSLLLVPILTVIYGKRWYCSWVCGCGGLANTFGEPWRHLSSKSTKSWIIEKISIHTVLFLALLVTAVYLLGAFMDLSAYPKFNSVAGNVKEFYGFFIIAMMSGVLGTGLYPIGGTRIWCRFACPMAAFLGLIQKFGRYRIRVKKNMCISCGLCSKYCEMGIDVRSYAQAGVDFTRASCVGCGLCAEVCPRGVLRLENKTRVDPQEMRFVDVLKKRKKL